jgi:drug/metabolite transporter (DMT)-like permease
MLSTLGAIVLMGETPTLIGLVGLAAVISGIGLIATQGDLSSFRRPGGKAGIAWGTATGGLIASYTVVDAYAVKALGIAPVVLDWFSNIVRFLLLAPIIIASPRKALQR